MDKLDRTDIAARHDIVEICSRLGIPLQPKSGYYVGECPACGRAKDHFYVWHKTNTCTCFAGSCGAFNRSDIFDLIIHVLGLSFVDAMRWADNLPLKRDVQPKRQPVPRPAEPKADHSQFPFNSLDVLRWHDRLLQHDEATDYLLTHGVYPDMWELSQIGFTDNDPRLFEWERNRLIFPWVEDGLTFTGGKLRRLPSQSDFGSGQNYIALKRGSFTQLYNWYQVSYYARRNPHKPVFWVETERDANTVSSILGAPRCMASPAGMLPARTELLLGIPYLIMLTDMDRNEAGMKAVRAVGIDDFVIVPTPEYKDVGDFRYNDAVGCEHWIRDLDNDYSEQWHEDPLEDFAEMLGGVIVPLETTAQAGIEAQS